MPFKHRCPFRLPALTRKTRKKSRFFLPLSWTLPFFCLVGINGGTKNGQGEETVKFNFRCIVTKPFSAVAPKCGWYLPLNGHCSLGDSFHSFLSCHPVSFLSLFSVVHFGFLFMGMNVGLLLAGLSQSRSPLASVFRCAKKPS